MSLPKLPTNRRFLTHLFNSLAPPSSPDALSPAHNQDRPSPLDSLPDTLKKQLLALQVLFPTEFVPALDVLDRHLVTRFRVRDEQDAHHEDDVVMFGAGDEGEAQEETHIHDDVELNENANTRKTTTSGTTPGTEEATASSTDAIAPQQTTSLDTNHPAIYYVRSAQHHRSSRYTTTTSNSTYDPTPHYQVRLSAWNCSCPAFTFAAFPACSSPDPHPSSPFVPVDPFQVPQDLDRHGHEEDGGDDDDDDNDDNAGTWSFGGVSLGDDVPPVCKHLLACLLADKCSGLFGDKVQERWVSGDEAAGWAAGWGD
ncbi:uncharacterized protein yc1106_08054 [Curvularia clavata]|uniref:SWIM-type domain-containing protein n=1 Tax=Curvularia clavata TaxID=95742 RepID=A0A9Q8ZFI9_CURCL|nr:uncharacterized protein yc1106_08054 [Curvularia clavata]